MMSTKSRHLFCCHHALAAVARHALVLALVSAVFASSAFASGHPRVKVTSNSSHMEPRPRSVTRNYFAWFTGGYLQPVQSRLTMWVEIDANQPPQNPVRTIEISMRSQATFDTGTGNVLGASNHPQCKIEAISGPNFAMIPGDGGFSCDPGEHLSLRSQTGLQTGEAGYLQYQAVASWKAVGQLTGNIGFHYHAIEVNLQWRDPGTFIQIDHQTSMQFEAILVQ